MLLVGATMLAVLALVAADARRIKWAARLFKTLASLGFVAVALQHGALTNRYGVLMLIGLVLSALGDVLLMGSAQMFRRGVMSFLVAHLVFGVAFLSSGVSAFAVLGGVAVLAPLGRRIIVWLLSPAPHHLRLAVIAYVTVISLMVALAAGAAWAGRPSLLFAAVLFYLSDLSVARDTFVAPGFLNRAWGLPLYYSAQLIFACSTGVT
jgi:uncharacterized membrane protein YhhN